MSNQRSTSLMIGDMLVYADDATLLSIKINTETANNNLQDGRQSRK